MGNNLFIHDLVTCVYDQDQMLIEIDDFHECQ
jgi:hypothetical protein